MRKRCRKNLPLGVRRLTENPYESPADASLTIFRQRSLRRYAIASVLIVAFWLIATGLLFFFGVLNFADSNVSVEYTTQSSNTAPLGDPTISTHLFYVNTFGAVVLWGIVVALTLATFNGLIAFRRGKADA